MSQPPVQKVSVCQFGLRTLLLLMTLAAMGSAGYGWRLHELRQWERVPNCGISNEGVSWKQALTKAQFISLQSAAQDPRLAAITVPEGFQVEIAAESPLIEHPIMAGFDDRGRLFVAENAGRNLKREDLEKELPNSIVLLTDTDGDGVFDKRSVFADKLTFPQGALWHDGWLYVASSGAIWRFKDTNNDDVADVREQIVSKFGYTGNAADVHGCFLGPEGRIYWCEGRHGHEITDKSGAVISKGKAARIFSCNPDGSDVQTHCGGGMDNPTEIDFTATGEMLGTVNILYPKRGDCLVHWLHGGVYPRADQPAVLAEFRRTGELLDAVHDFGHVAVSGLCRYRPLGTNERHGFGPAFHDQWFVTEFNTHKLKRVALAREGSTFRAEVQDFLTSTSNDFHPTDVLQDADGSVLLIDTGGWFRIGCPTSQIAKPEVPGAIYRIRRTAQPAAKNTAQKIADPWGIRIPWSRATAEELIELLADSRFAVRARAVAQLVRNQDAAVPYLAKAIQDDNTTRRLQAAETLLKIGSEKASSALISALESEDSRVRQFAAFGLGSLRETQAVELLTDLLRDEQAEVQLAAATALGKIGKPAAIPEILAALAAKPDRSREHALIYALIEIDDPAATRPALAHASPLVQRAGLIALDQMPSSDLRREEVAALLSVRDLALQTAVLEVISRRAGWTDELVASLDKLLAEPKLDEAQQALAVSALVAFSQQPAVQELIVKRIKDEATPATRRQVLLETIAQCHFTTMPGRFWDVVNASLKSKEPATLLAGITAARRVARSFVQELRELADNEQLPAEVRLAAFNAWLPGQALSAEEFNWLSEQLDSTRPPAHRMSAARTFAWAQLLPEQKLALTKLLAAAGPLEIHSLLIAFEQPGDETLGKHLAAALLVSPGTAALSLPELEALLIHYPPTTRTALLPLIERMTEATREQRTKLDTLSSTLATGNPSAGKQVFFNRQAGCYLCHRIGNEGGLVGPDLSTIGQRRNQRDLLEAVLFPSSSFARGYESHALLLADGRTLNGMILRELADAIIVRSADQTETRVARSSIEEMKPSAVSIMPAGLENTMSKQQLADLIAYLLTLR